MFTHHKLRGWVVAGAALSIATFGLVAPAAADTPKPPEVPTNLVAIPEENPIDPGQPLIRRPVNRTQYRCSGWRSSPPRNR